MAVLARLRFLGFSLLLTWGTGLGAARPDAWVELRSPHFTVYSNAGEAEARTALLGFEGIRSVFDKVIPGLRVDPPKPMLIVVVEDEAAMKRLFPKFFTGQDPSRPAGVFIGGAERNYAILRLDVDHQADQPYFVLFHEYTHSIVHQNFPALPTWLDEGIADFYGATQIRADQVFIGRVPRGRLQKLRSSVRLPMETLLTVTHDSPHYQEGEKTGIFYAQSWALVHYLFLDEQAQKAGLFGGFLKASQVEPDPLQAARSAFGDLGKLTATVGAYANRSAFRYLSLPLALKLSDADFQVRRLDEAQALVVQAEFLQHTHLVAAAEPLLARAQGLAPKAPEVQAALALSHLLRGEAEPARQAFQAALALGSQDFRVPYHLALLAQQQPRGGAAEATQILAWLEAARDLRPDFPGIHMALCRQYSFEPRDPARALQEGRRAVELEPNQLAHRINLGVACLNLDLEAEAQAIAAQLRRLASSEAERRLVASYESRLAAFLERKQERVPDLMPDLILPGPPGQPPPVKPTVPLKFSLPDYMAPLGREVMGLLAQDRDAEAIRRVEAALAKAGNDYDRKALRGLLAALKGRGAAK